MTKDYQQQHQQEQNQQEQQGDGSNNGDDTDKNDVKIITAKDIDDGVSPTGTKGIQNDDVGRMSSMRRQSIRQIQDLHGHALQSMCDEFPNAPVHELVRFLKARNFDFDKSKAMYQSHLEWKQSYLPTIDKAKAQKTLETRKFYLLENTDEEGRPIIVYCFRRFQDLGYDIKDEIDALFYMYEYCCKPKFGPSLETQKCTVLIDVSGIRGPPLNFLKEVNALMEANYPETLHRTIMLPVPYLLQKLIKGCLFFVAEETRKKFSYVNDTKSLQEFALLPVEQMGPDIAELIKKKQLKHR